LGHLLELKQAGITDSVLENAEVQALEFKYSFWMIFVMSEIDSISIERFGPFFLYVLATHSLSP
jgi:hypothetical protein